MVKLFSKNKTLGIGLATASLVIIIAGIIYLLAPKQVCQAQGKDWRQNTSGEYFCERAFSDAGQTCYDNDECQGSCVANFENLGTDQPISGTCAKYKSINGCFRTVDNSQLGQAICAN